MARKSSEMRILAELTLFRCSAAGTDPEAANNRWPREVRDRQISVYSLPTVPGRKARYIVEDPLLGYKILVMAFGERWWARQRTALPRNRAMRIARRGPASGSEMAFGAAPEPGGPAATSSLGRLVRNIFRGEASRRLRWSNLSDSPAAGADAHSSRTSHRITLPSGLFGCTHRRTLRILSLILHQDLLSVCIFEATLEIEQ